MITEGMFIEVSTAEVLEKYLNKLPDKGRLLEIGTGAGHSTLFFSEVKPNWTIYTIDGFGLYGDGRVYKEFSVENVKKVSESLRGKNIIQIVGDSKEIPWELQVDFLFIDGEHTYEGCKADFVRFSPFLKSGGFVAFHDYWRADFGVKQVVSEILGYDLLFTDKMALLVKS